ncbi:RNase H domain-containing protein [Trichonephila clavipes]|uniref:ribonuclease H n=1 Tax=Trichonephila clavipes TaxID=2585209 RepID=A0A8X6SZ56_TRICX|nr:RNase H domain-containing protein [Trichonephila clavipes]
MYHPPNQKSLPDNLLDISESNLLVGDLDAKHNSWGSVINNKIGVELHNLMDDSAHLALNDGSPTYSSHSSYHTEEALDVSIVSSDIFSFCKWTVLQNIESDHPPILVELKWKQMTQKRLDLLKYIAGRDWGADAGTLRLTYTSLIRPVSEYGSQIYFSASPTNLAKLDRVQSSAARIITGMQHSCPTDLVLFEADIMLLGLRRKLLLSKYFCKLYSYGDYNRTSAYLITWTNRHRLKRDSPFSLMQAMDLLDQDVEEHFLKNVFNPQEGLPRVHFKPEMGTHTSKTQDTPEYLRQLALEIINKIPAAAMQIYTDGNKDDRNSCGSGIFIKAPNCFHNIKIGNTEFCSGFRSELIAIDEALRIIKKVISSEEIWILCDSRSAIQHLSDWTNVGDKTSVSIFKNHKKLSQQHEIYFQWIPSHIGLFGNDTADLLAKEGVTEDLMSRRTLNFSEIFSKTKSLIQELWKTPPTHPWYNRQAPGGSLSIKSDRVVQTTISRHASGHTRGLSFHLGQKIYENGNKCNLVQATPDHPLVCAGLDREDIYSSPLLVYDFLRTLGLMDLV